MANSTHVTVFKENILVVQSLYKVLRLQYETGILPPLIESLHAITFLQ